MTLKGGRAVKSSLAYRTVQFRNFLESSPIPIPGSGIDSSLLFSIIVFILFLDQRNLISP